MLRVVLDRLVWFIVVLFGVTLATFVLMHAIPGGPWDSDKAAPPEVIDNLNRRYNLDQPYWLQYARFVEGAVRGDLGTSFQLQDQPVTTVLLARLPATLTLALAAFTLATLTGLALGVGSATHRGSLLDHLTTALTTAGASLPNFVLAIGFTWVLALGLRLVPTFGWGGPQHLLLPALTLAVLPAAYIARVSRAAALDTLAEEYVRTARSKGLSERTILLRHVLPNALIPILTVLGPIAAHFATGSFIVESIFQVPGVGGLFVRAVSERDYGLVMGATVLFATAIVVANLTVDLLYAAVDPRIAARR